MRTDREHLQQVITPILPTPMHDHMGLGIVMQIRAGPAGQSAARQRMGNAPVEVTGPQAFQTLLVELMLLGSQLLLVELHLTVTDY